MVTFDYKKSPITQIADYIIMYSAKSGASDIHFDPHEDGLMVRIRVDGDLQDYTLVPKDYERNLTTRLKLLANMNITESRLPQDGSIKGKFGNLYLDMRVSSLPTNQGEKIVIRILDYSRSLEGLESLGFSHKNFEKLKRMIAVPNGILLVTGATGSGKSTTTYSILQALNKKEVNIITVEDPVEMNIEGLNQVQVNSEIGLDFATVLRSILRQDPNVILIGEIRDSETAKIAVRASITGHFVLSTIHTNNSLATIERLLDMDVERYLLSSALTGIISQRLAKRVCHKCRVLRETTDYEKKVFKMALGKDVDKLYDANHEGCSECHNGYRDRIAVQEVLEIDDDIRLALNNENLTKEEMRNMVYTSNVTTLLQDGLNKVLEGITTFEEIYRIIEIDIDDDTYSNNTEEAENADIGENIVETAEEIKENNPSDGEPTLEEIKSANDNSDETTEEIQENSQSDGEATLEEAKSVNDDSDGTVEENQVNSQSDGEATLEEAKSVNNDSDETTEEIQENSQSDGEPTLEEQTASDTPTEDNKSDIPSIDDILANIDNNLEDKEEEQIDEPTLEEQPQNVDDNTPTIEDILASVEAENSDSKNKNSESEIPIDEEKENEKSFESLMPNIEESSNNEEDNNSDEPTLEENIDDTSSEDENNQDIIPTIEGAGENTESTEDNENQEIIPNIETSSENKNRQDIIPTIEGASEISEDSVEEDDQSIIPTINTSDEIDSISADEVYSNSQLSKQEEDNNDDNDDKSELEPTIVELPKIEVKLEKNNDNKNEEKVDDKDSNNSNIYENPNLEKLDRL